MISFKVSQLYLISLKRNNVKISNNTIMIVLIAKGTQGRFAQGFVVGQVDNAKEKQRWLESPPCKANFFDLPSQTNLVSLVATYDEAYVKNLPEQASFGTLYIITFHYKIDLCDHLFLGTRHC